MSVKKLLFIAVLFMGCVSFVFAQADFQTKPKLGVLPFSGGAAGDGEVVAAMLSSQEEVMRAFNVIPLANGEMVESAEKLFSMPVFADSEIIASIGRTVEAEYVVSGHIRRVGDRNLVIARVIRVDNYELVGGYHQQYRNRVELKLLMPAMARTLVDAVSYNRALGPRPVLAASPFSMFGGEETGFINVEPGYDAETLSQLLAIELAATGAYTVIPRAATIGFTLFQLDYRFFRSDLVVDAKLDRLLEQLLEILYGPSPKTREKGAVETVARVVSAEYVLSVELVEFGEENRFSARIFSGDNTDLVAWGETNYRPLRDGLDMMHDVSILLTDPDGAAKRIPAAVRKRFLDNYLGDPARFWSLGVSAGTSFPGDPLAIGTANITLAPFAFSFLRLGVDLGYISRLEKTEHYSVYPYVQYSAYFPFATWAAVYAGVGGGYLTLQYTFTGNSGQRIPAKMQALLADFTVGFVFFNSIDVSYTMRTPLSSFSSTDSANPVSSGNSKLSVGYTYRFHTGERW